MTDPRPEPQPPEPGSESEAVPGASDPDARGRLVAAVLGFARAAEGFARRTAGAFRVLAVLGLVAAAWLAVYARNVLGLPVWLNLPLALGMGAPPLVLLMLYWVLRQAIGLPERILETFGRLHEGASDVREALVERRGRPSGAKGWRFRDLVRAGRVVWALRGAGEEVREALLVARGAVVLWSPLFPVLLLASSVLSGAVLATGCVALVVHLAF